MKINKNILVFALLALMLLCCIGACSAEETLNETLGSDVADEIVVADMPSEELSVSEDAYVDANEEEFTTDSDAGAEDISLEENDEKLALSEDIPATGGGNNVIYVSTLGNDSYDGSSEDNAVATIEHAVDIANGKIIILPGEYQVNSLLNITKDLDIAGEGDVLIRDNVEYSFRYEGRVVVDHYDDGDFWSEASNEWFTYVYQGLIINNANLNLTNIKFTSQNEINDSYILNYANLFLNNCEFYNINLEYRYLRDVYIYDSYGGSYGGDSAIFEYITRIDPYGITDILYDDTSIIGNKIGAELTVNGTTFKDVSASRFVIDSVGELLVNNSKFNNSGTVISAYNKTAILNSEFKRNSGTVICTGNDRYFIYESSHYSYSSIDLNSFAIVDNCSFENSGMPIELNSRSLNSLQSTLTVANSIFNKNTRSAIYINKNADLVADSVLITINQCVFTNNSVVNALSGTTDISNSVILEDGVAITISQNATVTANDNWWGTNDKPTNVGENVKIDTWVNMNATCSHSAVHPGDEVAVDAIFDNPNLPDGVINVTFTSAGGLNKVVKAVNGRANITYAVNGDDKEINVSSSDVAMSLPIEVIKYQVNLTAEDLEMTYRDGSKLEVRLVDEGNNPVAGALIHVDNGIGSYKYRTDNEGIANVPINLKPGEYNYTITFGGDDIYEGDETNVTVSVNKIDTVISVVDENVTYKEEANYHINLTDINGNPISGATLKVHNGVKTLKYRTDADGVAVVPINLKPGDYIFIVFFEGNNIYKTSNMSSNVVVNKATVNMDAADLSVAYNDRSNVTVRLTDVNGDAISGVTVKFDNGINAYRYRTDADGVASSPIKFKPGVYTYTFIFDGNGIYAAANLTKTVTVNKVATSLEAGNVNLTYKNGNLTARLTDSEGNAIAGATIKFANGDKVYRYRTDSNGVATAPINLNPGEYDYTISYDGSNMYEATNITQSVVVNKIDTVLTVSDIDMTFKDGTNFTAKLTDINGNAISGVIVKVNNTVAVYKYKTDANGIIKAPINLRLGEYEFTTFFEGNAIYNPTNVTSAVVVKR